MPTCVLPPEQQLILERKARSAYADIRGDVANAAACTQSVRSRAPTARMSQRVVKGSSEVIVEPPPPLPSAF